MRLTWLLLAGMAVGVLTGCQSEEPRFRQNMAFKRKLEIASLSGENGAPTELSPEVTRQVADILTAMFGTPNEPALPVIEGVDNAQLVDMKRLRMAAGAVHSDQEGLPHGLYREHCVHCHGISGDGAGPTAAFLNPYPRDYRMGVYKFKSTKIGDKPTHDDLKRIVLNGVPGTAMPSFALLSDHEVNALVDYVRYLSIRGETERALFKYAVEMEDPFDTLSGEYTTLVDKQIELKQGGVDTGDAESRLSTAYKGLRRIRSGFEYKPETSEEPAEKMSAEDAESGLTELKEGLDALEKGIADYKPSRLFSTKTDDGQPRSEAEIKEQLTEYLGLAGEVMQKWVSPQSVAVPSPHKYDGQGELVLDENGEPIPADFDPTDKESIARGKQLFYGTIANCFSCHGESGLGDGQRDFYDAWSGELVDKNNPDLTPQLVALGALEPRNLFPRNLRSGVYRGGRRPVDLYWRITNGIEGAQMPAVPMLAEGDPPGTKKLSQRDVWDLINYVLSLPYESISQPSQDLAELTKEVQ